MFSNFNLDGSGLNGRAPFLPIDSFYTPPRYKSDARISKIIPFGESGKTRLMLNFEVFNISNSWAATGFTSSQAYSEAKGVITATPQNIGIPGSDGGFPDGTQARRAQVGARLVW
jgi:hypothetical protein